MDAIDQALMNTRLHYLGMAARTAEPLRRLIVLTCMDARIDVAALFGLRLAEAHVIRNAGGRVTTDALHAIAISQVILRTREVMVLHHTECVLGNYRQSELAERIVAATRHPFSEELGCFLDPSEAVLEDVGRIRSYPHLVHRDRVRGFIYDLADNKVTEVAEGTPK
jgi:carbonic anhydrase